MSRSLGENFPMIHSAIRMGIDRTRNPMTTTQVNKNRIICVTFLSFFRAYLKTHFNLQKAVFKHALNLLYVKMKGDAILRLERI